MRSKIVLILLLKKKLIFKHLKKRIVFLLLVVFLISVWYFPKFLFKLTDGENVFRRGIYTLNLTPWEKYQVRYVIDGDTIVVDSGDHIRFLGMNTPELHSKDPEVRRMAYAAREVTKKLVSGKTVFLVKDVQNTDKYGRLLRFIFLSPNDVKDITRSVNYYLVRYGYARVLTIPPNVAYKDVFLEAQTKARLEKRGLWKLED